MAVNKKAGKKSLAQNDFLFPSAPLIGTATDVGTSRAFNNGAATVTFTPDGPNAATSFTATSSPGGFTGTGASSPITVAGLQSDTAYTFTVTATNAFGTSSASSASASMTATTVPATPAAPSASSPSAGVDRLTWTAPSSGGKVITNYFWASNDSKSGNTASTTVDISQEQGTAQTYTIRADNANGSSVTSAASNSITTTFSFAPFGAFGFSPFGFSPFGFSPFGFSPFACLSENTKVATIGENEEVVLVEASKLNAGVKVFSPYWDEFSSTDNPHLTRVEYENLTNKSVGIGTISSITKKKVDKTIIFNNDEKKHYSQTQPVLATKTNSKTAWEMTQDLEIGDIVWEYDFNSSSYVETKISNISIISEEVEVYQVSVDGIDTFIAGNIICHNK